MSEPQEKLSANLRDLSTLIEVIENATVTPKVQQLIKVIDTRALAQELRELIGLIAATPPSILEVINAMLPEMLAQVWPGPEKLSGTLGRMADLIEAVENGTVTQEFLESAKQIDGHAFASPINGLLGYISRTERDMLEIRRSHFRTALARAWVFSERLSINLRSLADLMEAIENEAVTPEKHGLAQEVDARTVIPELRTLISMVAGTTPNSLEYMNSDYRAELGRIWTAPEKLSANLRELVQLIEAIETEAVTSKMQKLAQEIDRRALKPELRAVIRNVAGTSPSMLAFEQGDLRGELRQVIRSLQK